MSLRRANGFTLVELITVLVITGILAGTVATFFRPAIDMYLDVGRRATLVDMADTALTRIARDIRSAVPNSVVPIGTTCLAVVPTIAGGRYRIFPDKEWDDAHPTDPTAALYLDENLTPISITALDVLSPLSTALAGNDLVIDNTNKDVYSGSNRATIQNIGVSPADGLSTQRITLTAPKTFPGGDGDGRFTIVDSKEQVVYFSCIGKNLYRLTRDFTGATPTSCPSAGAADAVLASAVRAGGCSFDYIDGFGSAISSGFVRLTLTLQDADSQESITLVQGVFVDNI